MDGICAFPVAQTCPRASPYYYTMREKAGIEQQ
jgi:hypothetical protein